MTHYPHCSIRLYANTWIIVLMYGAAPMTPIWMISVYFRRKPFVFGVPPRTNIEYLYSQQSLLSSNRLYYHNIMIFMYKGSNDMLPDIFHHFIRKNWNSHSHCTHQPIIKHLCGNFRSVTRGQRSCQYSIRSGISYWTTLTIMVVLVYLKSNLKYYS